MLKGIAKVEKVIKLVTDATHTGLEFNQFKLLLILAKAGADGLTIGDLAEASGYQQGSCSRLVHILSEVAPKGRVGGYGLVEINIDLHRPRYRIVTLSTKGRQLVNKTLNALGLND